MLTTKQQLFIDLLQQGKNIFLTGKAGTGKSFVVRHAIELLKQEKRKLAAIAPTGIAANNIDGQTIHSLFQLTPYGVLSMTECAYLKSAKRLLLENIEILFIDEISMLRPDVLDSMHWTLRKNQLNGLPSKQLIFIGDLKQLPVILDDNTRSVLYETYNGDTFLDSHIIKQLDIQTIELDEVMRQSDMEFISELNIIREGGKSPYFRNFVHKEAHGIILAPYNATVQDYNEKGLALQKGELIEFHATITGTTKPEEFAFEKHIKVKNGCKIMYLVNSKDNPLRNGTIGMFVSHGGCHYIRVNDTNFALEPITVTKKNYVYDEYEDRLKLREVGSITQYPIKLAYALSIHKAQGMTFDKVTVDLRKPCFQKGMLYVALSRVKTPEGLRLIM